MIFGITCEVLYHSTRRNALLLTALLAAALCLGASARQEVSAEEGRTISIGGAQGAPSFSLRISASNAEGRVEVRDASGARVQSLACSLLRDEAHPTAAELEGVRQQFILNFSLRTLTSMATPTSRARANSAPSGAAIVSGSLTPRRMDSLQTISRSRWSCSITWRLTPSDA